MSLTKLWITRVLVVVVVVFLVAVWGLALIANILPGEPKQITLVSSGSRAVITTTPDCSMVYVYPKRMQRAWRLKHAPVIVVREDQ